MQQPLLATLKQHGYSVTQTRQQVYEVLRRHEPLAMQQLIPLLPGMNRTSVYRTIELFEQLGIVQRLQIGWKHKIELSNEFQDHHHHLTCLRCGQTSALPEDPAIERQILKLARSKQFTPTDHQLEISGLCSRCAAT